LIRLNGIDDKKDTGQEINDRMATSEKPSKYVYSYFFFHVLRLIDRVTVSYRWRSQWGVKWRHQKRHESMYARYFLFS